MADVGSATDVGIVLAAATFPLVAFLLIGGVWADRLPRHRVMIVDGLIRFGLHAVLAALIFTGTVEIWHLVVIEALFGAAEAFFRPAYSGPGAADRAGGHDPGGQRPRLHVETVAEFAGPALATALVLGLGAGSALALDAGAFLVFALLLALVRPRPRGERPRAADLAELREGFREVRCAHGCGSRSPSSRSTSCSRSGRRWCSARPSPRRSMAAPASSACFRGDGRGTCSARCSASAGGRCTRCASASVDPRVAGRDGRLRARRPAVVLVPLFAAAGVGLALFGIWWETALAERVPPHALSRVSAYDWMGSFALLPIGYLLPGPLGDALGPDVVLGAGSALATVVLAVGLLVRETWTLRPLEPV